MVDLKIELPDSFFLEEERDGYLVSAKMKELWAVQLDLLNEFDRVCKKYNLRYILDFGTLLGAVRHKGFIPWDDDVDVSMLREDYDKLMEVGPKEFKYPYFLQTPYTDENFNEAVTKLRRSDTMYVTYHNLLNYPTFNLGIFIDIFVYDYIPADKQSEELIYKRTETDFLHRYVLCHRPSIYDGVKYPFRMARYQYYRMRYGSPSQVYAKQEQFAKSFNHDDLVGCVMYFDLNKRSHGFFLETTELQFENLLLPAPANYDELLRSLYGDYMIPVRNGAAHVMAHFDTSHSYKEHIGQRKNWLKNVGKDL